VVLQVFHTTPTTPAGPGFNTEITSAVRISTKRNLTESADLGEVATVEITVDDPNLSLSFVPRQAIALVETDAPSGDQRVFTGYIAQTSIVRCDDRLCMLTGRIWVLECAEFNALMGWRIVRGEASDRPQETAENRLLWLLSTTFIGGLEDLGLIDWADPAFAKSMPPVSYKDQCGKDVLADIASQTGLGFFAHIDELFANDAGLAMFDFNRYPDYASTLQLSNAAADIDLVTTFPISLDAKWTADGERIAPGVNATGANGLTSYGYSTTTQFRYGNIVRDQAAPMPNVTTQAALDAARARLLTQHQEPDERLTCRVQVPAAKVNAIRRGHSIPVKLTHVPERAEFSNWRVTDRSVSTPDNDTQALYDLDLDLVPLGGGSCAAGACTGVDLAVVRLTPFRIKSSGPIGSGLVNGAYEVLVEPDPEGPIMGIGKFTVSLPTPPDPRNLIVVFLSTTSPDSGASMGLIEGWTALPYVEFAGIGGAGGRIGGHYGCVNGSSITVRQVDQVFNFGDLLCQVVELAGVGSLQSAVVDNSADTTPTSRPGVTVTPTAGSKVAILTIMQNFSWTHDGTAGGRFFVPKPGVTELSETDFAGANPRVYGNPGTWIAYTLASSASGTYDVNPIMYEAGPVESAVRAASITCVFECRP